MQIRPNSPFSIKGCVNWIDFENNIFALTPTHFTDQAYVICRNLTDKKPNQNSYIFAEGHMRWKISGQKYYRRRELSVFDGELILNVESWRKTIPDFPYFTDHHEFFGLPADLTLKDYKRDLLRRIEGLEPFQEDFFVFSSLSAPSFGAELWQSGGINLTLYDSTQSGLSKLVLDELRRVIPPDMSQICSIETSYGKFGLRHDLVPFTVDIDKPLPTEIEDYLTRRIIYDGEVSMGLFSKLPQPNSFTDKPCAFGDIITVLPEATDVYRSKKHEVDPDTFKYMLAHQILRPEVENLDLVITNLGGNMEKLRESFGLDALQLTQYGFLNANYSARPSQIVRQALSSSRAQNKNILKYQDANQVYEDYFRSNFEYVYDFWEDLFKKKSVSLPDRAEYSKIRRIIRKYDQGNGVDEKTIINEVEKKKPQKTMEFITEMSRHGWIYAKRYRKWRLTYG